MPKEKMNVREAQKQARQMTRFFKAFQHLAGVLDRVVDAEDHVSAADLHVKNAHSEVAVLEEQKAQLEQDNAVLKEAQENIQRQGKTLAETLATYEEQVNKDVAVLKDHLEDHVDRYDEALKSMAIRKEEFVVELRLLHAEKDKIESVVAAFQEASAKNQESKDDH